MKILIAGAGGLVGKALTRHLSDMHQIVALQHSDLDITDARAVKYITLKERPELIINCAVLGVDACERNPDLAWDVNVAGTDNLAMAAVDVDADFLQMSTNYVFDGSI